MSVAASVDEFDDVVVGLRSTVSPEAPVSAAEAGAAVVVDLDTFACLSGRERDETMMAVEREIRRLVALRSAMVRRVEMSKSYVDDGHLSARGWFAATINVTTDSASREVRMGRMLADMPLLASACERGDVGSDQLRVLARLHGNARCRSKMAESDALLTGHAVGLHVDDFTAVARRWMAWADPDGRDPEVAHHNRDANIHPVGAGFSLRARGGGVDGEAIAEIFAQFVEAERLSDIESRRVEFGDAATDHPLPRTPAQRRADALMQMVLKSADAVNPTSREPLINLFCTPDELTAAIQRHVDPGGEVPSRRTPVPTDRATDTAEDAGVGVGVGDDRSDPLPAAGDLADPPLLSAGIWPPMSGRGRLCETAGGAPVDYLTLLMAALIGKIRRVVIDSTGRVVDLGRKQRLFTGAVRDAILLAGNRCCWPGCDIRGPGVQVDHLTEHHAGGHTNVFNGAPMCPLHNRFKHRHRVTVHRDTTGWHFRRPDGTEIAPRPG